MKKTLFIAGNFLSRSGGVCGPSESLAERFASEGWVVTCAGKHPVRGLRVLEILIKALTVGRRSNVCMIEVYSGNGTFFGYNVYRTTDQKLVATIEFDKFSKNLDIRILLYNHQ